MWYKIIEITDWFGELGVRLKIIRDFKKAAVGLPNLKITQEINRLFLPSKEDSFKYKLIAVGYVNIILGLRLQQYLDNFKEEDKPFGSLTFREIITLTTVTDLIRNNPGREHSIESLRRLSGLSVPKLQEGFKEMYNCTVGVLIEMSG